MNIWWLGTVAAATIGCPAVALAAARLRRERLACQKAVVALREVASDAGQADSRADRDRFG